MASAFVKHLHEMRRRLDLLVNLSFGGLDRRALQTQARGLAHA